MAIHFKILLDGAFVAGDDETGFTSYAYVTSAYAVAGKRKPLKVATAMMHGETASCHQTAHGREYDARNWETLKA